MGIAGGYWRIPFKLILDKYGDVKHFTLVRSKVAYVTFK